MTDDAPAYFNAWSIVFQDHDTQKILCLWHVWRNWIRNLKAKASRKKFSDYAKILHVLCHEKDEEEFVTNLRGFLLTLGANEPSFYKYFTENYCTDDRIRQWAAFGRDGCEVNTNMYLERFHRTLKYKYLKRKCNNRVDFVLNVLLRIAYDFSKSFHEDISRGDVSRYRLSRIHSRHQASKELQVSHVRVLKAGESWQYISLNSAEVYDIKYWLYSLCFKM